jgi:hypothetical protein
MSSQHFFMHAQNLIQRPLHWPVALKGTLTAVSKTSQDLLHFVCYKQTSVVLLANQWFHGRKALESKQCLAHLATLDERWYVRTVNSTEVSIM